jgi:hypothetical protein
MLNQVNAFPGFTPHMQVGMFEAYGLIFARLPEDSQPDVDLMTRASRAVLRTAALADHDRELDAARTVVAWANGFNSMELAGAFHLGGDVDRAYAFGIERLPAAVARVGRTLGRTPLSS